MRNKPETTPKFGTVAHRQAEAFACHAIEGNPMTSEDIAMFEMFDRKGWTGEQRRAYMVETAQKAQQELNSVQAAE